MKQHPETTSFSSQPTGKLSIHQNSTATVKLEPLVKWAGGKENELKYIIPQLPEQFNNYFEPFVGGGAVYTAVNANHYYVNDRSSELIDLYRSIHDERRGVFFEVLDEILLNWQQLQEIVEAEHLNIMQVFNDFVSGEMNDAQLKNRVKHFVQSYKMQFRSMISGKIPGDYGLFEKELVKNLFRKVKRLKVLSSSKEMPAGDVPSNIEAALKSAFYMHLRWVYNRASFYKDKDWWFSAVFLFIRNYAYSGMFRYNSTGGFNVPYGGMEYNRKNLRKKLSYLQSVPLLERLRQSTICNEDFEVFLGQHPPGASDFVFLDPPYDSDFSTYAQNEFNRNDQQRLAEYLTNRCKAKWMMVIKNTEFISELYADKGLFISTFDKKYLVSFMNRNNKSAEHLLIKNYESMSFA